MEHVTNSVRAVARDRAKAAALKVLIEGAQLELESTNEFVKLDMLRTIQRDVKEAYRAQEEELRELALEIGEETGTKKILGGVDINKAKVFTIVDENLALSWAKQNLPQALKLDKTIFKKMVMVLPDAQRPNPDVVKLEEKEYGKVRLASDLSFYVIEAVDGLAVWLARAVESGWVEDREQFVLWWALSPWWNGGEEVVDEVVVQRWFEQVAVGLNEKKMILADAVVRATELVEGAIDG
jgi:hypothetical protein